jgi:hypothetical protein
MGVNFAITLLALGEAHVEPADVDDCFVAYVLQIVVSVAVADLACLTNLEKEQ